MLDTTKRIFVTRNIPDIALTMLRERGYMVDVFPKDRAPSPRELAKLLSRTRYDAVLSLLTDRIDAAIFDAAPTVKIYSNYATGFDNIDVAEATKRGITVANAPAERSAEAVAEHTIALMFALAARIVEADEFVRRGKYTGWAPMNFIGMDVLGKTLGLIGVGRIGSRVGFYAQALGMKVLYYDVKRNEQVEKECGAEFRATPEDILREADIVSLHVPLLDSTRHLINESRIGLMKPTAFLVNTSRGPVIDEVALTAALQVGAIAGAALDVFEFEPKLARGLVNLQNVILTPHIASASVDARNQMAEIAAKNIIEFFDGTTPTHKIV